MKSYVFINFLNFIGVYWRINYIYTPMSKLSIVLKSGLISTKPLVISHCLLTPANLFDRFSALTMGECTGECT